MEPSGQEGDLKSPYQSLRFLSGPMAYLASDNKGGNDNNKICCAGALGGCQVLHRALFRDEAS